MKHRFKILMSCTAAAVALSMTNTAQAQLEQATGIADPGRAERSFIEDSLVPQGGPDIRVNELTLQTAPAGAENILFNFGGIIIEGADAYSENALFEIYGDKIGTQISLADLYDIANEITLKYRNDGYILTQVIVPPQTIEDGIVRLRAVEGFINNISVQGDESKDKFGLIEQYARRIDTSGGALNIETLERQLLLINDLPGVSARSVISPSRTTVGAADLLIIVERDPFEALVGVNNHGSRFLGPVQFDTSATFNSLFGYNDQITARFVGAPDAGLELAFWSLEYKQPIGSQGTTISALASLTDTDPGYTLDTFEVLGISRFASVEAEHPFIRSREKNLSGRLSFDWRKVESRNNINPTTNDTIRALRAGLRADFLDDVLGVAVNTVDIEYSQGIDVFGASEKGDANLTRAEGDPTFSKVNVQLQRLQRLANNLNLVLTGRAQLANNPLLSSEEFGLGGISTVRGYDPSEVVGDDGIAANVEFQYNNSPIFGSQLFGFLDSGTVWNQDETAGDQKRDSLTSVGFGLRGEVTHGINAEFVAAQPLHRDIETQGERDPQFFFSLSKSF